MELVPRRPPFRGRPLVCGPGPTWRRWGGLQCETDRRVAQWRRAPPVSASAADDAGTPRWWYCTAADGPRGGSEWIHMHFHACILTVKRWTGNGPKPRTRSLQVTLRGGASRRSCPTASGRETPPASRRGGNMPATAGARRPTCLRAASGCVGAPLQYHKRAPRVGTRRAADGRGEGGPRGHTRRVTCRAVAGRHRKGGGSRHNKISRARRGPSEGRRDPPLADSAVGAPAWTCTGPQRDARTPERATLAWAARRLLVHFFLRQQWCCQGRPTLGGCIPS